MSSSSLCLSVQVLQELYVTLVRRKVTAATSLQLVRSLDEWTIVQLDVPLVLRAIKSSQRWQISYWDAAIIEAARTAGCDTVWSEDLNDGQDLAGVVVNNPLR